MEKNTVVQDQDQSYFDDDAHFISLTSAWQMEINKISSGSSEEKIIPLFQFFEAAGEPKNTLSIYFSDDNISSLISSVGIKEIRAKFALAPPRPIKAGNDIPIFTIILYGVDSQGSRSSAYYIGQQTSIQINNTTEAGGNISDPLAIQWIHDWVQAMVDNDIDIHCFGTRYGNLNGFTYQMSDFMNTLYPPGKNIVSRELNVMLALHKHHSSNGSRSDDTINTFGLVLVGSLNTNTVITDSFTMTPGGIAIMTFGDGQFNLQNETKETLQVTAAISQVSTPEGNVVHSETFTTDGSYVFYDLSDPSPPAP